MNVLKLLGNTYKPEDLKIEPHQIWHRHRQILNVMLKPGLLSLKRVKDMNQTADRQEWLTNLTTSSSYQSRQTALIYEASRQQTIRLLLHCAFTSIQLECVHVVIINKDRAWVFFQRGQASDLLYNHRSHCPRLVASYCEKISQSLWLHRAPVTFPSPLCHCWLAVWLCFDCKTPGFSAMCNHVLQFGA